MNMSIKEYRDLLKRRKNKKNPKYQNKKVKYQDKVFDSALERDRYIELSRLQRAGKIRNLVLQVKFPLIEKYTVLKNNKKEAIKGSSYYADFAYYDTNNNLIIEDIKGVVTPTYSLKKKLFLPIMFAHNVYEFREVYKDKEIIYRNI